VLLPHWEMEEASLGCGAEPDFKVEEENTIDLCGELDEEIHKLIKPEPPSFENSVRLS
jgi:hypothetical protein